MWRGEAPCLKVPAWSGAERGRMHSLELPYGTFPIISVCLTWSHFPCANWGPRSVHSALYQGFPTPGPRTGSGLWPVRNRATQQVSGGWVCETSSAAPHCFLSLALLPEPSPPSVEKLPSMKLVPGAKKVGGCWFICITSSLPHSSSEGLVL